MSIVQLISILVLVGLSQASGLLNINLLQNLAASETKGTLNYSSYQGQIFCTPSTEIIYPNTTEQVRNIVRNAISKGLTVKALGSRHSGTDIICTDGIPVSMANINYTDYHARDKTVTLGAGIQLTAALEALHERNRTLIHCPTYGGITIGGAIGTGAHGSSLIHPPSISDQVVGMTIVDARGKIVKIRHREDLKAFRVHLGLLGIIINVTLKTVPLFKMTVENTLHTDDILADGTALDWAREYDTFQMWWFPHTSSVVVSKGTYHLYNTSVKGDASSYFIPDEGFVELLAFSRGVETFQETRATVGLAAFEEFSKRSLYEPVVGKPQLYSEDGGITLENPATGYAWKLLQNKCNKCVWDDPTNPLIPEDFSISINLNEFKNAVATVKRILSQTDTLFYMVGIYLRFSKASDAFMATSSGQEIVDFEWIALMRKDPFRTPKQGLGGYQAIQQALIKRHGGRPHWGKNGLHYLSNEVLEQTAVNKEKFIDVMMQYDPNGLFANKFRGRLLGNSNKMDIHPEEKSCALQDTCICREDTDCADDQLCNDLDGFRVCLDKLSLSFIQSNLTSILKRFNILRI